MYQIRIIWQKYSYWGWLHLCGCTVFLFLAETKHKYAAIDMKQFSSDKCVICSTLFWFWTSSTPSNMEKIVRNLTACFDVNRLPITTFNHGQSSNPPLLQNICFLPLLDWNPPKKSLTSCWFELHKVLIYFKSYIKIPEMSIVKLYTKFLFSFRFFFFR